MLLLVVVAVGGTIMGRGFPVSECVSNPEMTFITAAVHGCAICVWCLASRSEHFRSFMWYIRYDVICGILCKLKNCVICIGELCRKNKNRNGKTDGDQKCKQSESLWKQSDGYTGIYMRMRNVNIKVVPYMRFDQFYVLYFDRRQ